MKDWQARVSVERDELAARHNKLCEFIDGDEFPKLERAEQVALERQSEVMADYHGILTERMARFR